MGDGTIEGWRKVSSGCLPTEGSTGPLRRTGTGEGEHGGFQCKCSGKSRQGFKKGDGHGWIYILKRTCDAKSKSDGARVTAGVRLAAITGVHRGQVGAQTRVVWGGDAEEVN